MEDDDLMVKQECLWYEAGFCERVEMENTSAGGREEKGEKEGEGGRGGHLRAMMRDTPMPHWWEKGRIGYRKWTGTLQEGITGSCPSENGEGADKNTW